MTYQAKDFSGLIGTRGFSEKLLTTHFKLYEGYVTNTNKVADKLSGLAKSDDTGTPEYGEMRRRFGWEFNGMRLHELYFGNMANGGNELEKDAPVAEALKNEFGSLDDWQKEFDGVGKVRGIGWACMFYDPQGDRVFNCWLDEHDGGLLATAQPLLLMDVFEHAFMLDYGTDRASYIKSFQDAVDWNVVNKRFEAARQVTLPATA